MTTLHRVRLSRGSLLVQVAQSQPIIGTPALVPVPRKSSSRSPAAACRGPAAASVAIAAPVNQGGAVLLAARGGAEGTIVHVRRLASWGGADEHQGGGAAKDRNKNERQQHPLARNSGAILAFGRLVLCVHGPTLGLKVYTGAGRCAALLPFAARFVA